MRTFRSRALMALILVAACDFPSATAHASNAEGQERVRHFLQQYLLDSDDKTASYMAAFVDLTDDGSREVIVYFTNQHMCGSGGCSMLILAPQRSSYKVVGSITIAWPPVRVLKTMSHGWHDIAVGCRAEVSNRGTKRFFLSMAKAIRTTPRCHPPSRLAET